MTIPAGYFSLVTVAPESLTAEQCLPHFDSPKSSYFAVMQYINDDNFGGTSFYQHRQTGYENIGTGRQARYLKVLQSEAPSNAGKGYIIDSDACFERIGGVSYRPNRLVIYEGGDHGLSAHRQEVFSQVIGWFDRYLKVG